MEIHQLRRQMQIFEEIECKRAYFYAELSHDIKQPLQALKILIALLQEENLNSQQADLVSKIKNSAAGLEAWLDNLMSLTQLESGGLKKKSKVFSLDRLLKRIAQEYQEITVYKNLKFTYSGDAITYKTDVVLLERIVRNLLHNAIKYAHKKINLKWYELPDKIKIIVKDDGRGLKKEECRKLFKAFYRCPRNQEQGMGLGLAIVKELADILKIKIDIKSKWHRGSVFILTLKK